eukprot:9429156-Pyramimonas_sp.AAC.1
MEKVPPQDVTPTSASLVTGYPGHCATGCCAACPCLGLEHVWYLEVGADASGRLVGHLDAVLKHRHRKLRRRVGGHPQPEVGVHCVRLEALADTLQRGHPARRQVAVLQQHPGAHALRLRDERRRLGPLPLPHADRADLAPKPGAVREGQQCRSRVRPAAPQSQHSQGAVTQHR